MHNVKWMLTPHNEVPGVIIPNKLTMLLFKVIPILVIIAGISTWLFHSDTSILLQLIYDAVGIEGILYLLILLNNWVWRLKSNEKSK